MKTTRKRLCFTIIMCSVAAYLAVTCLWNLPLTFRPIGRLLQGKCDFPAFTEQIQESYVSSFSAKDAFINLNGACAAALKQNVCNEVIKFNNGMLGLTGAPASGQTETSQNIIALGAFLDQLNIPLLYVQVPVKMDSQKSLLPSGLENYENESADALLQLLSNARIHTLDMRPALSATPEQIEKYFFRTDHHWNFDGAFAGFQMLVQELQGLLPGEALDVSWTDPSKWQAHELEKSFLGSRGKRVGIYFGGLDDVTYYTPIDADSANYSYAVPANGASQKIIFQKGNFSDAFLFPRQIDPQRSLFQTNPYALYLNNDYPIVQVRNPDAPNGQRILFLKNSFALPLIAYCSTLFREVDAIDPRHYCGSIAEYVLYTHPDVVIEIGSSPSVDVDAKNPARQSSVFLEQNFEIREDGYASLPVSLAAGRTYTLEFEDVQFSSGGSQAAAVALFDEENSVLIDSAVFDIEYCRNHGGFLWRFTVPPDAQGGLDLRFCAGLPENMLDNSAVYRNVRLDVDG